MRAKAPMDQKVKDISKLKSLIIDRITPLNPVKIILFGSYAYGIPNSDSDLDLCIIKDNVHSKIDEKLAIRQLLKDFHLSKDILLPSSDEYNFYKKQPGSVYFDIEQNGIVLWPTS